MSEKSQDKFYMTGTTGTGEFVVYAVTEQGRLGVRDIGCGAVRIRVEPSSEKYSDKIGGKLTAEADWKQPNDDENKQFRFSKVTDSPERLRRAIESGLNAIGANKPGTQWSEQTPAWVREMMPAAEFGEDISEEVDEVKLEAMAQEALDYAAQAKIYAEKCRKKAEQIRRAKAAFQEALSGLDNLGIPRPDVNATARKVIEKVGKPQLILAAKGAGIEVTTKTPKTEVIGLIFGD